MSNENSTQFSNHLRASANVPLLSTSLQPPPTGDNQNNGNLNVPRIDFNAGLSNVRMQLYGAFFVRFALVYARAFPATARRCIEFVFLLQAFIMLAVLVHLHLMFVRSPITCLDHLRSADRDIDATSPAATTHDSVLPTKPQYTWPRYGILRIEVIKSVSPEYGLLDSYAKQYFGMDLDADFMPISKDPVASSDSKETTVGEPSKASVISSSSENQEITSFRKLNQFRDSVISIYRLLYLRLQNALHMLTSFLPYYNASSGGSSTVGTVSSSFSRFKHTLLLDLGWHEYVDFLIGLCSSAIQFIRDIPNGFQPSSLPANYEDNYIIEYALESGFLRLSPAIRKRLNITVKLILLDPEKDACFGGWFSRFLMEEFLGYDDLLMGSIKHLASTESVKGYIGNMVTGHQYRLVNSQMSRSSYFVAVLVMILFTFCISALLRYSSHQLVLVVADILQLFESNTTNGIPAVQSLTIILALVAMETIMSEFFGDSFTAVYVILIVSLCDHFEVAFCRTEISRQYWPRFFFIYQFGFYAYHYRFNGQFNSIALWVSWLFILHSMIYFFHHYELPNMLSHWELNEVISRVRPDRHILGSLALQSGGTSISTGMTANFTDTVAESNEFPHLFLQLASTDEFQIRDRSNVVGAQEDTISTAEGNRISAELEFPQSLSGPTMQHVNELAVENSASICNEQHESCSVSATPLSSNAVEIVNGDETTG